MKILEKKMVEFLFNFRIEPYNVETHHCQHLVEGLLNAIGIQIDWTINGPISSFFNSMNNVERDNYPLSYIFGDITKDKVITCHKDLKDFWDDIQDPLKYEITVDEAVAMERVNLIKNLEEGYISRGELGHEEESIDFSYFYSDGLCNFGNGVSLTAHMIKGINDYDMTF